MFWPITSRVVNQPASASRDLGDEHPEIDPRYVQFFVDPLNPGEGDGFTGAETMETNGNQWKPMETHGNQGMK